MVEWKVKCVDRNVGNYYNWLINGQPIVLRLSRTYTENLEKSLPLLECKIRNNEPLTKIIDSIQLKNTIEIIKVFFEEEFLLYVESYFKENYSNGKAVCLADFVTDMLYKAKSPKHTLSKDNAKDLRDKIINKLMNGQIEDLDLRKYMLEGKSVAHISEAVGVGTFSHILIKYYQQELIDYVDRVFENNIKERKLLTYTMFCKVYLNNFIATERKTDDYLSLIKNIVLNKYNSSAERLINENIQSLDLNKDEWKIYVKNINLGITVITLDFSCIMSKIFKYELKKYYKNEITESIINNRRIPSLLSSFNICNKLLNFMYEKHNITCFRDFTATDVNILYQYLKNNTFDDKGYKLATISKIIGKFRKIVDYLIENEKDGINYKKPKANYFKEITIRNIGEMYERTEVIPDIVMEQIHLYKNELSEEFQLMFDIFEGTGMRLKEVSFLEEDCLEYVKDGVMLRYTPYKVINSRKKLNRDIKEELYITPELSEAIKRQKEKTKDLRKEHNTSYIFVNCDRGKVRIKGIGFCSALNKIIKRHNITDHDGILWRFDSRQMRKTVSATMIQNGATETEVMQQLKHLSIHTTRKHYEDVEKLKLAQLNDKFFEEKFKIKVGEKQLSLYTEEERKALYVDFALSKREVEFGQCSKHISEGVCGERTGTLSCANCPKLCTGKKYLDKWESLATNQRNLINELESAYLKENIPSEEYTKFVEYKRELNQLHLYENVIKKIIGD